MYLQAVRVDTANGASNISVRGNCTSAAWFLCSVCPKQFLSGFTRQNRQWQGVPIGYLSILVGFSVGQAPFLSE